MVGEDTGVWPPLREMWTPTPVVWWPRPLAPPCAEGSGHRILTSSVSGLPDVMSKHPQKLTQTRGPTQADQSRLNYFLKFFQKTLKYEVLHNSTGLGHQLYQTPGQQYPEAALLCPPRERGCESGGGGQRAVCRCVLLPVCHGT